LKSSPEQAEIDALQSSDHLLKGLLFDDAGHRMIATAPAQTPLEATSGPSILSAGSAWSAPSREAAGGSMMLSQAK
jgi:hypothetical protein